MDESTKIYLSVLPIRNIVVTLRFIDDANPRFYHQLELTSMLRHWLPDNEAFERSFRIDAPEAGQSGYRAGDLYRFTLYALGECDDHLLQLLQGLQALPASAVTQQKAVPFRNNIALYSLQDGFDESPFYDIPSLCCYDHESLQQEVSLWQNIRHLRLRWISPARLLKDKQQRQSLKGEARFCRDSEDIDARLLLSRLHDRFAEFHRHHSVAGPITRSGPPPVNTHYTHLFWVDNEYHDASGKGHVIGGLSGLIEFSFNPDTQTDAIWPLLILGQFTGIGQRTSFGYGRYLLETLDEGVTHRRCLPAQSLIMRAATEENLQAAYRHILQNTSHHQDDELLQLEEDETAGNDTLEDLQNRMQDLQQLRYQAPELHGYLIEKSDGGVRPLSVPPFRDRILQRALAQIITPALEQLFYQGSYGYRPGRSRITAKQQIQLAWRQGYRWVYESDIEDFFDSVQLKRLQERLVALYDNDPAISAIINWMSAPVRFEGELIQRKNGLPQGSPLSPLMANLMLDDFDSDMQQAGFLLIRYADDFIVLCKDREQAEQAHLLAQQSLAEHGLALNQEKTHIKPIEQGFKYLGYLFVNDMALDVGKDKSKEPEQKQTQPHPWLSNIAAKPASKLKQQQVEQLLDQWAHRNSLQLGEREQSGALLCITGNNAIISTSTKQIQVHRDDKLLYNLPWRSLQAILLFGNHHFTTPAMHAAMEAEIPVHFASSSGQYRGTLWNAQPANYSHLLWIKQSLLFSDPDNALYAAQQVVKSRLIHMKETLRQRKLLTGHAGIDKALRQIGSCKQLAELNGHEGNATRVYFQLLQHAVPEEFGFNGRNRRPPTDPFNALLSLGYTMLYGYTESIIRASGLLPWVGFYHQPHGKHATLASDLMEPFRHLVERTALTVLNKQTLKVEDFEYRNSGACYLHNSARRKYLAALTQRLEISIRARGQEEAQPILAHLQTQCQSLIGWINSGEPFHAWRIR